MSGTGEPSFRALRDVGFAKEQAWRMSMAARGEATDAATSKVAYTQQDYEDAMNAAKARIAQAKADGGACVASG